MPGKRDYAQIPKGSGINRSMFDISENHKTTFNGDYLIPIYWDYFYPGEIVRGSIQAFVRVHSPLDYPIMDNMRLTIHWYAVALRNLWTNFRKFYGERVDPGDSIDYSIPELGSAAAFPTDVASGDLQADLFKYMGVPVVPTTGIDEADFSALPFRAYNQIYNWHYRDQQQQDSVDELLDDGPDDGTTYVIRKRGKRHDYLTSALLAPQRGESVTIGGEVGSDAAVGADVTIWSTPGSDWRELDAGGPNTRISATTGASTDKLYPNTTINELRNATAIQQFLERDNRYGQRFDEQILAHFGVEFNDLRIEPLFLGGGSGYINTTTIPNQSATTGNLGDLSAIAHGALDGARFTYAFDEPCILMCIANVSADISYQRSVQKKHSLRTRYDMFYPEFARIGDQAVLTQEVYYANAAADTNVFGYVPRYEHMRIGFNRVTGEFNSHLTSGSLDPWHLAEELGSTPVLGTLWIQASTPYDRIQAVTTAHDFIGDFNINLRAARALPVFGVPGMARL